MYNIVLAIHVIVVIALIGIILVQRGRSGGLVEALGGVESIFGTKTSSFFVKITVVLAILFFTTSISLAYLSKQKGKSLMGGYQDTSDSSQQITQELPASEGKESAATNKAQIPQAPQTQASQAQESVKPQSKEPTIPSSESVPIP